MDYNTFIAILLLVIGLILIVIVDPIIILVYLGFKGFSFDNTIVILKTIPIIVIMILGLTLTMIGLILLVKQKSSRRIRINENGIEYSPGDEIYLADHLPGGAFY
jgi:hypothetical protein